MNDKITKEPKPVTEEEMRDRLRRVFEANPEESLLGEISRGLLDPAKPYEKSPDDQKRRPRLHPLVVVFGGVLFFIISVFIYFSYTR